MIKNILNFFILLIFFIFVNPAYPSDYTTRDIEKYTLKISKKFAKTYCNSTRFGISKDGALKFSIGETSKEFSNNKLNKFIDSELLHKNIILSLENNCQIFDFPENELDKLTFNN